MFKFLKRFVMVEADCGHKTRLYDEITVVNKKGEKEKIGMIISTLKPSHCHKCFEKMAIRCAWCGGYIIPGQPITLYSPNKKIKIPEYAIVYKEKPKQLVGCLRRGCSIGGDRAGFWVVPGKVQRVLSPIEEVMMTGEPVIISNLGNIREAKQIQD